MSFFDSYLFFVQDASKSVDNDRKLDLMAEKKDDFVPEELVAVSALMLHNNPTSNCAVYLNLWNHIVPCISFCDSIDFFSANP